MHIVVCYDVVENKRRSKLHKRLGGYIRPVQKSVFEGHIPVGRFHRLLEIIGRTIDRETDTVRVYHLCRACRGLTHLIGASPTVPEADEDLVV